MNRRYVYNRGTLRRVPRASGDEPGTTTLSEVGGYGVPRASGDEPRTPDKEGLIDSEFPAQAGMNRLDTRNFKFSI